MTDIFVAIIYTTVFLEYRDALRKEEGKGFFSATITAAIWPGLVASIMIDDYLKRRGA